MDECIIYSSLLCNDGTTSHNMNFDSRRNNLAFCSKISHCAAPPSSPLSKQIRESSVENRIKFVAELAALGCALRCLLARIYPETLAVNAVSAGSQHSQFTVQRIERHRFGNVHSD